MALAYDPTKVNFSGISPDEEIPGMSGGGGGGGGGGNFDLGDVSGDLAGLGDKLMAMLKATAETGFRINLVATQGSLIKNAGNDMKNST